MRFTVTGEWTRNSFLKLIIFFFLVYVIAFWVTNFLLYFHVMDLSYQSVVNYYLGSEEQFTQPKTYRGLLEVSHFHLFAMGILLMTLTHLLLFAPMNMALKCWLICLSFGSAFFEEASSWLVRFVHPAFAYLKILSFLTLQITLAVVIIFTLHALLTDAPSAYNGNGSKQTKKCPF